MSFRVVIVGTDTDIGKTVFSAALVHALNAAYWKPIQSGLAPETDTEVVARLSGADAEHLLPEIYRLVTPASPHRSAEIDGIEIVPEKLTPPKTERALVIEAAGGLAVPLRRDLLQIDLLAKWQLPVILCASTRLGTINHSLLSIEALKRRNVPILGIAFIGDENADSEHTIVSMGGITRLGRLPRIDPLTPLQLHRAFAENFSFAQILQLGQLGARATGTPPVRGAP